MCVIWCPIFAGKENVSAVLKTVMSERRGVVGLQHGQAGLVHVFDCLPSRPDSWRGGWEDPWSTEKGLKVVTICGRRRQEISTAEKVDLYTE